MKETYKVLLIALSSRLLVALLLVLFNYLFGYQTGYQIGTIDLPFVNLFFRMDSPHYLDIALNGYPHGYPDVSTWTNGVSEAVIPVLAYPQWAFFPLYSAVMRAFGLLLMPFYSVSNALIVAGFLISNFCFFVSTYFLFKLTNKLFNSTKIALVTVAFYSFWIGSVTLSAVYSESLFMALTLASFYYLEEGRFYKATFFGFLATFTRSDGFIIFIPFFVYAIQQLKTLKTEKMQSLKKSLRLVGFSGIVASPYLLWNIEGYFVAGGVFPVQVISRNLNWGVFPNLYLQFTDGTVRLPVQQAYLILGILFILIPTVYPIVKTRRLITTEAQTLKYWAFYFAMLYVLITQSSVFSVIRYAIPLLPIYWVSAKIYGKNRFAGGIIFVIMTGLMILSTYFFETGNYVYQ